MAYRGTHFYRCRMGMVESEISLGRVPPGTTKKQAESSRGKPGLPGAAAPQNVLRVGRRAAAAFVLNSEWRPCLTRLGGSTAVDNPATRIFAAMASRDSRPVLRFLFFLGGRGTGRRPHAPSRPSPLSFYLWLPRPAGRLEQVRKLVRTIRPTPTPSCQKLHHSIGGGDIPPALHSTLKAGSNKRAPSAGTGLEPSGWPF